jgi:hypothetical protein
MALAVDLVEGALRRKVPFGVEEVVPPLPANPYRPVTRREQRCWGFTLAAAAPAWARSGPS